MESVKKWLNERSAKKNGMYVHYSPPKLVGVVTSAQLRQWARRGAESRLERAVLAGQGRRLLAEAESLPLSNHSNLPGLVAKCAALHTAVERGSLLELQELLESDYNRRKYVVCRDEAGVGLLHKAVFYDYMDIAEYLVKNYPQLVHQKDSEGRTALHYTAVCRDEAGAAALLEGAGAARGARDAAGRTPAHYRGTGRTLLALPDTTDMARENKNTTGLVIKRHNIRIWCHDCDMARLQRVVWEGHGSRLLSEVSNQPVVKRFLEAVPYIMNTIRDIHTSVIQNDLEGLMKHSGDPVPPQALSSRDPNNLTVMHKAAGLGHGGILKYIANRYPQGINDIDNDGRTPLHYAAAVRDDQHTYNTLVTLGADESAVDNKNKTPGYYVNRPQEIDKNIFKILPEAPRTPSSAYPSHWDWKLLDTEVIVELNKKSRRRHLKASNENISSKDTNTNTTSESTDNQRTRAMKGSSTHELINNLPDLDDSKEDKDEVEINKESDENEKDDEAENKENEEGDKSEEDNDHHEKTTTEVAHDTQDAEEEQAHDEEDSEDAKKDNAHHDEEDTKDSEDDNASGDVDTQVAEERNPHGDENAHEEENSEGKEDAHKANDDNNEKDEDIASLEHETTNTQETLEHPEDTVEKTNTETEHTEDNLIKEDTTLEIKESEDESNEHEAKSAHTDKTEENTDNQDDDEKAQEIQFESKEHVNEHQNSDEENSSVNELQEESKHSSGDNPQDHDENKLHEDLHESNNQESHDDENKIHGNGQVAAELGVTANEGNSNDDHNEDDDDVQVQGESNSEYSDSHLKSTADISDMGSAKRGNVTNGRSTQESLIEGVINGEAEQDSQDASMTQREESIHGEVLVLDNEIDPEVTDLINNANMEMLATLVLNGEGSRLIGRRSRNSELQAFLDNVPTYMQKINKIHVAAREGNLRDLQAALDRRKFAIARDPISPNGATPLHVATIFGKTNIIKYLGGRFPETLSAVDFEGRTALHYAAVLPDNGHYYNLLQQLGANSKDLDDNGNSAEEYHKNISLLPFDHLLSDYGISEDAAKTMFSDKGPSQADNGHVDTPMFNTDEGRYLAKCKLPLNRICVKMDVKEDNDVYVDNVFTALGDPLIKGLTEVANVKPKDPVAFLASFLHNFPEKEKPKIGTQESNVVVAQEAAELENEQPPPSIAPPAPSREARSGSRTATRPHRPIDVVTVDPQSVASPDAPETAFSSASRDEHGQSMLHFAAARTHARNALFQLLQESDISLGFRDELYRTARDVSIQANVPENTTEIDRWVLHLAARGNTEKIMELLMEGYDHILDAVDEEGASITEVIAKRGNSDMGKLLGSIPAFEESREALHAAVRRGDLPAVEAALSGEGGRTLARSQNSFGRTALHIAVLAQHEDIVTYLAQNYPELLRVGDNLERTPLHYAMGVDKLESLSRILIRAGAKRVLKDLKGRQPTYYFMNKSDILRLKEEEDVY